MQIKSEIYLDKLLLVCLKIQFKHATVKYVCYFIKNRCNIEASVR
jgi:hypothetical protein